MSNCGEEVAQVVDVIPVTRALVDDHLEDAIDMVGSRSFPLTLIVCRSKP